MPSPGVFARFFTAIPYYNQSALTKRSLLFFIGTVPTPVRMMQELQKQGHFRKQVFSQPKKRLENYLQEDGFDLNGLKHTPVELLKKPLILSFSGKTFADIQEPYQSLIPVLEAYVTTIMNVFGDQLANRPYDPKEKLNENVSERGHAFQIFAMTHHLRVQEKNKFAGLGLQHDIARSTMADVHHGDQYHHIEADQILVPQGYSQDMATRFPFLHAFAKYMWTLFSKEYASELLSPVSAYSLIAQQKESALLMRQLDDLYYSPDPKEQIQKSEQLIFLISRMKLLRLIDDAAKAVMPESDRLLTPAQLKKLITERMIAHIQTLSSADFSAYQEALREALMLLRRTKNHSSYPERYQPIPDEEELLSSLSACQLQ